MKHFFHGLPVFLRLFHKIYMTGSFHVSTVYNQCHSAEGKEIGYTFSSSPFETFKKNFKLILTNKGVK